MREIIVKNSAELKASVKGLQPGDKVVIEEGEYFIEEDLDIVCDNVAIIGKGNKSIITGAIRVDISTLDRRNGIVRIDLSHYGIHDICFPGGPYKEYWKAYDIPKPHLLEQGPPIQLLFNGERMPQARYPKEGYLSISKALGKTDIAPITRTGSVEGVFIPNDIKAFEQDNVDNFCLIGYWYEDYAIQRHRVQAYDKQSGVVSVDEPYHVYGYRDGEGYASRQGGEFYILNTVLGLKEPGDWYINIKENAVYMIPYNNQTYVELTTCKNLITAQNKKNIHIESLKLYGAKECAVKLEHCENIIVKDIIASQLGAWGIIADGCQNTKIEGCHIYHTAGGGISCSGGNRESLESSQNVVARNTIHDIAWWHKTYMAAIEMNGVNVIATENVLYDMPGSAIIYQGNNHIIEKNTIKRVCSGGNDAGAIYAGRDFTCRGTIIRHNYFSELYGLNERGCNGIYFDDAVSSAEVYGNIFYDILVAIKLGGGREYDIHDNSFWGCEYCMTFDERLNTWGSGQKNIFQHLEEVPYQSDIWQQSYPKLCNILEDEPRLPKYNKFYKNKIIGGKGIAISNINIEKYLEHYDNDFVEMIKSFQSAKRMQSLTCILP